MISTWRSRSNALLGEVGWSELDGLWS